MVTHLFEERVLFPGTPGSYCFHCDRVESDPIHHRQEDTMRTGHPDTTYPADLLTHLRVEHHFGIHSINNDTPRSTLELAHAQRHAGFGVGADHAPSDHRGGGFQ